MARNLESGVEPLPFLGPGGIDEALRKRLGNRYAPRGNGEGLIRIARKDIAAGSMAQLHRGQWRDAHGKVTEVAVRVIKPGIEKRVNEDERLFL